MMFHVILLQQRNKPKEPPKVPKNAPFFLPTVAGLEFKFDVPEDTQEKVIYYFFLYLVCSVSICPTNILVLKMERWCEVRHVVTCVGLFRILSDWHRT